MYHQATLLCAGLCSLGGSATCWKDSMAMARNRNSTIAGAPFGSTTVGEVWKKGNPVPGSDDKILRTDKCGNYMIFSDYGKTDSKYGWEVDHIKPVAKDGTDDLSNLQPLYWETNRDKSDTYPWSCPAKK